MTSNPLHLDMAVLEYMKDDSIKRALMISGKWGSGKTHWWKNFQKEYEHSANVQDIKFAYVSLYRAKSTDDILQLLAYEYNLFKFEPRWFGFARNIRKHKDENTVTKRVNWVKIIGHSLSFISRFKRYVIDGNNILAVGRLLMDNVLRDNTKKMLLVLDDVERSGIPIEDVLSFANEVAEICGKKVLLICNEEELLSSIEQSTDGKNKRQWYSKIKEKTVYHTFQHMSPLIPSRSVDLHLSQYHHLFENILEGYDSEYSKFLRENIYGLETAIEMLNIDNVRWVKDFLNVFRPIYKIWQKVDIESRSESLLYNVALAYFNHLKKLAEENKEYGDILKKLNAYTLGRQDTIESLEQREELLEKMYKQISHHFVHVRMVQLDIFPLLQWMLHGIWDKNAIHSNLSIHDTPRVNLIDTLQTSSVQNNEDIELALEEVVCNLKKDEYSLELYGQLIHALNTAYDNIPSVIRSTITTLIRKNLNDRYINKEYPEVFNECTLQQPMLSYSFANDMHPVFRSLFKQTIDLSNDLFHMREENIIYTLFSETLVKDASLFFARMDHVLGEYWLKQSYVSPIWKCANPQIFASTICVWDNVLLDRLSLRIQNRFYISDALLKEDSNILSKQVCITTLHMERSTLMEIIYELESKSASLQYATSKHINSIVSNLRHTLSILDDPNNHQHVREDWLPRPWEYEVMPTT